MGRSRGKGRKDGYSWRVIEYLGRGRVGIELVSFCVKRWCLDEGGMVLSLLLVFMRFLRDLMLEI